MTPPSERVLTMDADKAATTKARILAGALRLFNTEGVGSVSALDIATNLGISPGHLYYHFRGKPELLDVLAGVYQGEVELVLDSAAAACRGERATLETLWTHVHILAEEAWDARFLYREAGGLALRYPDLGARIRRIVIAERQTLHRMLVALASRGGILAGSDLLDSLAGLMTTAIGFHAIELELEGDAGPDRDRIARSVSHIMRLTTAFAPAMTAANAG